MEYRPRELDHLPHSNTLGKCVYRLSTVIDSSVFEQEAQASALASSENISYS